VLGSSGFLGREVARACLRRRNDRLTLHVRHLERRRAGEFGTSAATVEADLSDPDRVEVILDALLPDVVVNCAAIADVDACERDPVAADRLNHRLPERIAEWCARRGTRLIHVSTDAVFDGLEGPYGPEAIPSPINVYGRSKRDGEVAVLSSCPTALVVRTNIIGWSPTGTRSLLEHFVGRLERGETAPGWTDVSFRPLPVHWFWPGCEKALGAGMSGVIHLTGHELLSKFDFGRRVADVFGLDLDAVIPTESKSSAARAVRPPRLDVVPSTLRGVPLTPDDLDRGLAELRHLRDHREIRR
jgi:dTDP-4-dehydrorhamnose reductase